MGALVDGLSYRHSVCHALLCTENANDRGGRCSPGGRGIVALVESLSYRRGVCEALPRTETPTPVAAHVHQKVMMLMVRSWLTSIFELHFADDVYSPAGTILIDCYYDGFGSGHQIYPCSGYLTVLTVALFEARGLPLRGRPPA